MSDTLSDGTPKWLWEESDFEMLLPAELAMLALDERLAHGEDVEALTLAAQDVLAPWFPEGRMTPELARAVLESPSVPLIMLLEAMVNVLSRVERKGLKRNKWPQDAVLRSCANWARNVRHWHDCIVGDVHKNERPVQRPRFEAWWDRQFNVTPGG